MTVTADLITSFNRKKIALICVRLALGVFCYFCAYLFFRYVPALVCSKFELEVKEGWFLAGSVVILLIITFSEWKAWREDRSALSYEDSLDHRVLNALVSQPTNGSVVVDHYVSRVTAPAFVLSRLFLAGPESFLRAHDHYRGIIPDAPGHLAELNSVFSRIKEVGKWHDIAPYISSLYTAITLHELELIELDLRKGRIKAVPSK